MKKFLFKVAEEIAEQHAESLSDIQIILPSKRSGLYLNQYLSTIMGKAFLAPRIITWDEFLEDSSGFTLLNHVSLTFKAYESYLKVSKNAEDFDEFSKWSHIAISDFNEIDNYLLEPKRVFKDLKNIKDIEDWSFATDELSIMQKDFKNFWTILGEFYHQFKADLMRSNSLYSGALKKYVAQNLPDLELKEKFTYWVGFYAVSPSEQKIIDYFIQDNKGYVYWDADEYYVDNPIHLAGHFFRNSSKLAKRRYRWIENQINLSKKVVLHKSPGNTIQANIASNIINENRSVETALILGDEQLLIPVLESLDSPKESFNVSLGLAMDQSNLSQLILAIFQMHEKAISRKTSREYAFYFKDVEKVLENHLIAQLYPGLQDQMSLSLKEGITTLEMRRIKSMLHEASAETLEFIFNKIEEMPKGAVNLIKSLVDHLKLTIRNEKWDPFTAEVIFKTNQYLNQLSNFCDTYPFIKSISSFIRLLKDISKKEQLDFLGEPLGGLQIIGMLESRTLDFERVIITSCNEGIIPSTTTKASFLPYDLRMQLKLPGRKEYEAIYAYYFYRLLHYSKEIHIIYNSKTPVIGSGELSRFISQLIFEGHESKFKPKVTEYSYGTELIVYTDSLIRIEKSDQVIDAIKSQFLHRISSSAITTFLSCSLDFYFKYILQVQDEDFKDEKVQPNTFGSILHDTLEEIYTPIISLSGKMNQKDLEYDRVQIKNLVWKVIESKSLKHHMSTAYNELAIKAIIEIIYSFLEQEKVRVKHGHYQILGIEEELSVEIELPLSGKIGLKGKIDRIDRVDGQLRIVDYKSPLINQSALNVGSFSKDEFVKNPQAFQLMFYTLLLLSEPEIDLVFPQLYSLRAPKQEPMPLRVNKNTGINSSHIAEFKEVLDEIIQDIMNPEHPFEHGIKGKYCSFC